MLAILSMIFRYLFTALTCRDDEDDFEDDEDVSWKARRAAARLLETVASNRKYSLSVPSILPALLKGVKDRDDGVKIQSLGALLAFCSRLNLSGTERNQFVVQFSRFTRLSAVDPLISSSKTKRICTSRYQRTSDPKMKNSCR